ncbi:hypothetical protein JG536_18180 [Burkholderia ambifaria]|uniref:DUF6516 family protein n=1 Tax=Burkholderia ambifaria TaxID=152480 RepID=UPI00158E5D92|nr:DUF6516 family protein [Burkholderia ambifaria]QQK00226.1 hypothetical protein JG536_18180 [Burkholderia ambifaria]
MSALPPLMNIDRFIEKYDLDCTEGRAIDSFFVCLVLNVLHVPRRFANALDMVTYNPLLWLALAKDAAHLHDVPTEQRVVAEFAPDADCPFHRLYSYRYDQPQAVAKEALVACIECAMPATTTAQMANRYSNHADVARSQAWVKACQEAFAPSTLIAEGRVENTTVEQVIVLARKGAGCVLCGTPATGYVGSTVGYPASILYIANTCHEHQEVAKRSPTMLHFIMELFAIGLDLGRLLKTPAIPPEAMTLLETTLSNELEAVLVNKTAKGDQTTPTFRRHSGFKIILRLKTLMNYGYMIDTPDGIPYRRIDAAPDHPDIPFFPDHIHLAPKKDNADVVSSFTYGFPLLDLPVIKRLLQEGEKAFAK